MTKLYSQLSSHAVDADGFDLNFDGLSDDKNPQYMFNCTDTDLLLQIARGEINAKDLAIRELLNRRTPPALWMNQDAN